MRAVGDIEEFLERRDFKVIAQFLPVIFYFVTAIVQSIFSFFQAVLYEDKVNEDFVRIVPIHKRVCIEDVPIHAIDKLDGR